MKKLKNAWSKNQFSQKMNFPAQQHFYQILPKNSLHQKRNELIPKAEHIYRKQGISYKWKNLSKNFLKSHPFCVKCFKNGLLVQATETDHIIPHNGNLDLFFNINNLQALCKSCHSRKTRTEDLIWKEKNEQRTIDKTSY